MTDKEIIKALECCASESIEVCQVCPYMVDTIYCEQMKLRADALDLINRRKAEIEELKLICDKERADRLYLSQQNKAIIAGQETLQKALAEKDREIDDLKVENQSLRTAANCYKFHYDEARSEAVREFSKAVIDGIDEGYISHSSDIVDFTADYLSGKWQVRIDEANIKKTETQKRLSFHQ